MIISIHLADIGARGSLTTLTARKRSGQLAAARYAEFAVAAPISSGLLPRPQLSRIGLIAFWEDDRALDEFLAGHPLAEHLAGGWQLRMSPLHVSGSWPGLEDFKNLKNQPPGNGEQPVAVLTLGHLRLTQTLRFLRTNAPAAGMATSDPGLLAATGLAALPNLLCTFSLWRNTEAMRAYAYGANGPGHVAAIHAHRDRPLHHQSAFIRLHPYAQSGTWSNLPDGQLVL